MFVRMKKPNAEGKYIVKFVTDKIGERLIKKGKATLVKEDAHFVAEKKKADEEAQESRKDAFSKKKELERKAELDKMKKGEGK